MALPARAKLNLDLEVVGRRADGFHDIRTTFQEIELHDLIELEQSSDSMFTSEGFAIDPHDNSVLKAQQALEKATGKALPARFHVIKRIPPGSGMGGASSDAATTLKALRSMYALDVDLTPISRGIGSDVPFFLIGGRALAEGRGERLTPLGVTNHHYFAVAWPRIQLSTADVYRAWDEVKGDLQRAAEHVEPRLKEFARSLGTGWRMTGSGSAFFKQTSTEQEARDAIADLGGCWTTVTR